MNTTHEDIESRLVPCEWTDKDIDIIVQYKIDKQLGLKDADSLTL